MGSANITGGTTVRERLLAAADELFYNEGVQTVGVDRIAHKAGASKKSLYAVFGNKEALILAYLQARRASVQDHVIRGLARYRTPRERLLGIFDVQADMTTAPGYNGCPFINASAEAQPGSAIRLAHTEYRMWVRTLLTDLATQAAVPDPAQIARQLHLLYDAATVAAKADTDPHAAHTPHAAATAILNNAVAHGC